ncbi:MAG: sigma-54 interaction domain-containing protein [Bacillota bacterium]|jgi:PAS domain S-box-containing protein
MDKRTLYQDVQKVILSDKNSILFEALEASSEGILIADHQGKVLYINKSYEDITGLKKERMLGKNLQTLLDEKIFNISASLLVLENKKTITIMHHYVTGKQALTTASIIYDDTGTVIGVINITRNISKLIKLKKELSESCHSNDYISEIEYDYQLLKHEGFIYKSNSMKNLINFAAKIAAFDSTILIQGESGTGKEVLARFIYQHGSRKDGPFIKVNCASIPTNLFESELFGYVPGAFTGASKMGKRGLFELANNGTILLDEISELPLLVQSKLLRIIQEKEVLPVGGITPIKLNVRIIACTNKDLKKEVSLGNFREDLFFRINVVPISIPPLRERSEDIPELILYFLEKLNKQYKKTVVILPETIRMLSNYHWPGNVRELENLIEFLFITNTNDEITIDQLPIHIIANQILKDHALNKYIPSRLDYMLDIFEKHILISVLGNYNSMNRAAEFLGIHPSTLSRKIKKYGIELNQN